jgi:ribosomal protein S8E
MANITKKEATINVKIKDKKFNDSNTAEFSENPTLNGVVDGDEVTLINGVPTFSNSAINTNIPINFTDFSTIGIDAENYALLQPIDIFANIITNNAMTFVANEQKSIIEATANVFYNDEKIKILVVEYEKDSPEQKEILTNISKKSKNNIKNIQIFEIHAEDENNNFVQPNNISYGLIKLSFKIPKDADEKMIKIIRMNENAENEIFMPTFTKISGEKFAVIEVEHFSLYALVEEMIEKSEAEVIFDKKDPETGIWVTAPSGVFTKNAKLFVEKHQKDTKEFEKIYSEIDNENKSIEKIIDLLGIKVIDEKNNPIQPNSNKGNLTIRFPISKENLDILKVDPKNDTEYTEKFVEIDGQNYCEIISNNYGNFALVDNTESVELPKEPELNNNNMNVFYITIFCLILLIILLIILIKLIKNRKK